MKTLIIIPAYNEGENLERVVSNLERNFSKYDYLIVNDGSKDNTEAVCRKNKYNYVSHPVNLGLTGAFQTGMKYAEMHGYDCAIQFDGDGQHNAEYIEVMESKMKEGYDIVIGSRFVSQKKPRSMRMIGNNLIQCAIKVTTGKTITDPTSGMRLFDRKMIGCFAGTMDLGPEPDTIALLIRRGAKIAEVQVTMNERIAGESYLNFTRSILYMMRMFISILILQWIRKV